MAAFVLPLEDARPPVRTALERLPQLAVFPTVANAQGSFVNWLRFGGDCLEPSTCSTRCCGSWRSCASPA